MPSSTQAASPPRRRDDHVRPSSPLTRRQTACDICGSTTARTPPDRWSARLKPSGFLPSCPRPPIAGRTPRVAAVRRRATVKSASSRNRWSPALTRAHEPTARSAGRHARASARSGRPLSPRHDVEFGPGARPALRLRIEHVEPDDRLVRPYDESKEVVEPEGRASTGLPTPRSHRAHDRRRAPDASRGSPARPPDARAPERVAAPGPSRPRTRYIRERKASSRSWANDLPRMPATVTAERIRWGRGLTILNDRVRELRPSILPPDPAAGRAIGRASSRSSPPSPRPRPAQTA